MWSGVVRGSGDAVADTWEGLKATADFGRKVFSVTNPALRKEEDFIKYQKFVQKMANDPLGSLHNGFKSAINMPKYIWSAVTVAWDRDVIHGDAESRTAFFTYGLTSIGISVLGDKGISKIGTVGKAGNISAKVAEYIPKINKSPELVLADSPVATMNIPYNVLNDPLSLIVINHSK